MIRVFVPSFREVDGPSGRSYITYTVEVNVSGVCHKLERRYRTFHTLHKNVRRLLGNRAPSGFPPKRIRSLSSKLLEQRRAGLERYLQGLLRIPSLSNQVLSFLELPTAQVSPAGSNASIDSDEQEWRPLHQPLLSFLPDPYPDSASSDTLPDVVTRGVLKGLFGSDYED